MQTDRFEAGCRFLNEMAPLCRTDEYSFRIHYWDWRQSHYNNHLHKHSYYEVCAVLSGEGEYQDEDQVYTLGPGSMFVSRPGVWHQIRSETGLGLIYVAYEVMDGEYPVGEQDQPAYGTGLSTSAICVDGALSHWVMLYWLSLYTHATSNPYHYAEQVRTMGGILLANLLQPFNGADTLGGGQGTTQSQTATNSALLRLSKQYIRDNLSQPLRLGEVAAYMNVSTRQLSRLFQQQGGDTYVSYVRQERLKAARTMLQLSTHSIKEIAELTGFQSLHYFTQVFTKEVGLPPGEYRRRNAEKK